MSLKSLKDILRNGGHNLIIPFGLSRSDDNQRLYSTPWDSEVYRSYSWTVTSCHVVIIVLYSDGATMAKYGTQSAHLIRIRFSNLRGYSEKWITTGIAPTSKLIPESFPVETRRRLKMQMMHRFIYVPFKQLVHASYSVKMLSGQLYIPRIAMYIADPLEERTLLSLKRRHSRMDCTHCTLPKKLDSPISTTSASQNTRIFTTDSDTDKDAHVHKSAGEILQKNYRL